MYFLVEEEWNRWCRLAEQSLTFMPLESRPSKAFFIL